MAAGAGQAPGGGGGLGVVSGVIGRTHMSGPAGRQSRKNLTIFDDPISFGSSIGKNYRT
jgi:hypothetical protein